jgi:hypothetical protein
VIVESKALSTKLATPTTAEGPQMTLLAALELRMQEVRTPLKHCQCYFPTTYIKLIQVMRSGPAEGGCCRWAVAAGRPRPSLHFMLCL